ncbi:HAD family hydrolase [candidate division WOR-3 bacterium]|nr:HAD family hydrolase [candidate division WOR-3 bacterium]
MNGKLKSMYSRKKAVIFDLFHTLITLDGLADDVPQTHEIIGVTREEWEDRIFSDVDEKLKGIEKNPYNIMEKMIRALKPSIEDELILLALKNRTERFERALLKVPEISLMSLEKMKKEGKLLGLISNADVIEISGWDNSPLKELFDAPVFSCRVGCMKPEKEIYCICLEKLGVKARDSFFVGDGGSDELPGAKNAGLETVMITGYVEKRWPHLIPERKKHADFVIRTLDELS